MKRRLLVAPCVTHHSLNQPIFKGTLKSIREKNLIHVPCAGGHFLVQVVSLIISESVLERDLSVAHYVAHRSIS